MRASVQFPREKFVSAACSSASSGTVKAKILSSSVCSSGFICTLDVMTDGQANARPPVLWNREPPLTTRPGHRWGHRGCLGWKSDISSGADLTRPTRACCALLPCAARCDIPPLKGPKSALPPKADIGAEQINGHFGTHSIISSARCCKNHGTSSPSVLAVLRLMTNSNLLGSTTGRSAGLVPLRIRPA